MRFITFFKSSINVLYLYCSVASAHCHYFLSHHDIWSTFEAFLKVGRMYTDGDGNSLLILELVFSMNPLQLIGESHE